MHPDNSYGFRIDAARRFSRQIAYLALLGMGPSGIYRRLLAKHPRLAAQFTAAEVSHIFSAVAPKRRTADAERIAEIVRLRRAGKTLAQIGATFGIGGERVRNIIRKFERHNPDG